MGEIEDIVTLYIEESDFCEDKLDEISLKLRENIQNNLYYGHGRDTGNLRDSIESDFVLQSPKEGLVRARIIGTATKYGWAVNDGYGPHDIHAKPGSALNTPYGLFKKVHHPGFGGLHFMEEGLEETIALYG